MSPQSESLVQNELPAPPTSPAPPRRSPGQLCAALLSWSAVLWALGLVFYFLYKEGLINWAWLQAEPGRPRPVFFSPGWSPSEHAHAFSMTLANLFSGEWHIWWDSIPWSEFGWSALSLGLMVALGYGVLGMMELYLPRLAGACLALVVGAGLAGVAFELLTMAHLLRRGPVIALWVLLLAASHGWALWRRQRHEAALGELGGLYSYRYRLGRARKWLAWRALWPDSVAGRLYFALAVLLIALISLLTLLHAVGTPETYWDALILYMGYARKIFLQQSFPYKVVGQVGIGLGANYPHLYALLTAQTAAMAGYWSDSFAQLLPPVAGLASTILVYYLALEMTRNRLTAISAALIFRAVPYGIAYNQYASDYAVAILLSAAFLYCAQKYIVFGLPSYLTLLLIIAGCAVHINYLMGSFWIISLVVIWVAHLPALPAARPTSSEEEDPFGSEGPLLHEIAPPAFLYAAQRPGFLQLLRKGQFWATIALGVLIGSPWYLRNTILTGNPVYAFFYNIFPSKHVNPAVMRSACVEWLLNGDGVGRVGNTLPEKLANSWLYFVSGAQHWKLAPVFVALVLPGVLVFLARLAYGLLRPARATGRLARLDDPLRFGIAAGSLFLLLWFYEYVVADFYLYHIIFMLPLFGVFFCFLFDLCRSRASRSALYALCLVVGFAPGVVMGLMGFKLLNGGIYGGRTFSQIDLTALKNLFMEKSIFYRMAYGGDMDMFAKLSLLAPGSRVLTHENRHLLLSEELNIMHLDDWEVQAGYGKPAEKRAALLDKLGVDYYLYIPNEDKHIANSWLGMDELIRMGYFRELWRTPSSGHSVRDYLNYRAIPPDQNVLYERVKKPAAASAATGGGLPRPS